MTEPETPTTPPPPPPADPTSGGESGNRGLMVVLSYLWILALVPLLVEKEDKEVQWHAKHGLVLTVVEIILWVIFNVLAMTGIGCIIAIFFPLIFLAFIVVRVICIVKGVKNERFLIPGISQYADKF